ncbi:MFS general substrate transporter [Mycena venus]|uniref:MFS general substrate transporter n=1 Tax=Mycena venus TaxID=2733690 RepID=A0A8H6Y858_9AGAR|nr:MFS general substrate transporter [Mycena venus]
MDMQGLKPVLRKEDLDEKDPDTNKAQEDLDLQSRPSSESSTNVDDFPDGGLRAWAVVLGAFCTFFATAWIGSVARCMIFLPGVLVGRLSDLGYFQATFATGSVLIIAGTFLIPVCTLYWHFLLCQGFMIGIGYGLTYGPCVTIITHWWKRKRALAFGVASSGSAVGGVFFPVALRNIIPRVGFSWTLRIMGFILILTFGVANLCLARRLPPHKAAGGLFGLHVFRNPAFSAWALSAFLGLFGAFNVGAYVTSSAVSYGISSNIAFYFVAMYNGASLFGSVGLGFLADRLGAMNILIPTTISIGIITIVWPFCGTVASLCVISVLYGLTLGAFGALGLVPIAAMGGTEDLGRRMGIMNTVLGIGTLCGAPLAGLLTGTSLGFKGVGYFSGGMIFGGPYSWLCLDF